MKTASPIRLTQPPSPLFLALLAVAGQFVGLYSPGSPDPLILPIPGADKIVHVVLFAVPVALLRWAGVRLRVVLPLALAQVVVSEVVQARWIPYRAGELADALADLVGIGLGVLGGWWLGRDQRPAEPTPRVGQRSSRS
ncbi:MAG TPA: VanZ family protein [Propionibacterium sp.]|nr:VanZ family protein [Propionibacterium sp.]